MSKLTDLDAILLSGAAKRDTGSLLPAPETVSSAAARLTRAIDGLIKHGFVEERETSDKPAIHRTDDNTAYGLYITSAGNAAIGVTDAGDDGANSEPPPPPRRTYHGTARPALYWRFSSATRARRSPT